MIDPEALMKTAEEGSKALTKFQEVLLMFFGPRWKKKETDAEIYDAQKKAQFIRDNQDMEVVYIGNDLHIREKEVKDLNEGAVQRQLIERVREEYNLENVIRIAADDLLNAEEISDEPVDEDILTRIFGIVKDISNVDMQLIWGKILAGEIKKPGSFSLRTLDVVRNLTQKEAEAFQSYLPYVMLDSAENAYITSEKTITEKYSMDGSFLFKLNACGLLQVIPFTEFNVRIPPNETERRFFTKNRLLIIANQTSRQMDIIIKNVYLLTEAGKELYNLLCSTPNDDYFLDWVKRVFESAKVSGLKFSVHGKVPDKDKQYYVEPLVSYE